MREILVAGAVVAAAISGVDDSVLVPADDLRVAVTNGNDTLGNDTLGNDVLVADGDTLL
jgi:hypothetical protein